MKTFLSIRTLLSIFVSTLLTCNVFAHALWMETASTGKIGKAQEVRLYFGEYAQNERDELSKWRSDLKDLTLWLVCPDGTRQRLFVRQDSNAVVSSFTPAGKGVYTLLVSHLVTLRVLVKNAAKAGNTVLVFSPSGWSQELTTTADGAVHFTPLWPGK